MRHLARASVAVIISIVTGCAGSSVRSGAPSLAVALASNRYLELEPCGCALDDLGGVEREFVALSQWKSQDPGAHHLNVSSGTTFVPYKDFSTKHKPHYLTKAKVLVAAMNELGVDYLSPSSDDLALGVEAIRALERKAKFKFLSANLVEAKRPLFAPYAVFDTFGKKILVIGVTRKPSYRLAKTIQVLEPLQSIRAAIRSAGRVDLTVVLSSLDKAAREKLVTQLPEVELWLGGGPGEQSSHVAVQPSARQLYIDSHDRGRGLMTLSLELVPGGVKSFFNPAVAEIYEGFRAEATEEIGRLKKAIASQKNAGENLSKQLSAAETRAKELSLFPASASGPGVSTYSARPIPISSSFAGERNPLTEVISAYKTATKRSALQGVD